ncbi:non-ribosomal peptide synthetase [Streptomyces scabiei]|uniref:non-ribosomal peptide synthetase n=1 Tax=Streptomyces scabiei TaxID=1930 RepID=UPI000690DB2A|nr:non-ribosomal peptide synthetase [Streptomyces scabiei]
MSTTSPPGPTRTHGEPAPDRPETSFDRSRRVETLLLDRWNREPDRAALIDPATDTVVTAADLRERVLWTARALRERGVRPGDLVVVHQERSVAFVVSILGVLFAGGAQVALDVNDPPERTLETIADCGPRLLITGPASRLTAPVPTLVVTGKERDRDGPPPHGAPDDAASVAQPAVVLYTSGSTGRPKASLISHGALVSRLSALQGTHPIGARDRIIHHTTCTFDMFLVETYWPLLAGATVVIAAPGRQRDTDYLARLIREYDITTFYCVVSLLELFLLTRDPGERYDGLRQVLTGGEPLSPELVKRLHSRSTASLTNLYGPSECTIYCTAWECPRDPEPDTVLIGSAIADTSLWILDPDGKPVADGEAGELYIGGAGLALGYLNRPELTRERFVPDTLGEPGGRLYRSGDLVRTHPSGALEFLGRVDRQIKIRGVRIEPGEIESAASRCAGVRQTAVVTQGQGSAKRLVAFVVAEPDTDPTELVPAVRAHLRSALPSRLVPSVIRVVGHLPLTANGKLDGALLTQWAADASAGAVPDVDAIDDIDTGGPLEDVVARIWRAVLGADGIDPDADFFDIGGDSFKAVRIVKETQRLLAVTTPLETLLQEPTVRSFSTALRQLIEQEQAC